MPVKGGLRERRERTLSCILGVNAAFSPLPLALPYSYGLGLLLLLATGLAPYGLPVYRPLTKPSALFIDDVLDCLLRERCGCGGGMRAWVDAYGMGEEVARGP